MVVEHKHYVKRTIYVAECKCDKEEPWKDIIVQNPPRERMCPKCGTWCSYHEQTSLSEEYSRNLLLEQGPEV